MHVPSVKVDGELGAVDSRRANKRTDCRKERKGSVLCRPERATG